MAVYAILQHFIYICVRERDGRREMAGERERGQAWTTRLCTHVYTRGIETDITVY